MTAPLVPGIETSTLPADSSLPVTDVFMIMGKPAPAPRALGPGSPAAVADHVPGGATAAPRST